jgi:hypothetical protein
MTGVILEIASGSGGHVVHFARNLPALDFQPSDPEPDALLSVAAWMKATVVTNVRAPIALDALHSVWPIASADRIICINMIHISPCETTLGLIKGAAAIYTTFLTMAHASSVLCGVFPMIAVQPAPANSNAYLRCAGSRAWSGWLVT